MWAWLFLIRCTFLCLNPILLLYSCGVMGMMRLNDVHSIPKTRLPIFCYWINKFYHIRSAFLLLFPSPSFFLDIAARVGCGQKSKLTPRNYFFPIRFLVPQLNQKHEKDWVTFYLHCKGNHVIWKLLISISPSESLFVSWPYCLSDSSVNCSWSHLTMTQVSVHPQRNIIGWLLFQLVTRQCYSVVLSTLN